MKQILLIVFLFSVTKIAAQQNYRFSVGGGFHSLMYWGFRSFEDVVCPTNNDVYKIYKTEKYDVDYGNFSASKGFSIGFSVNWINRKDWAITQQFSLFKSELRDRLKLTLTDIGDGTESEYYPASFYYNASNTKAGSVANIDGKTVLLGFGTSLVAYRKTRFESLQIGCGVYYINFYAEDFWLGDNESFKNEGYHPIFIIRATGNYTSQQLGLSLNGRWSWKFISLYATIGNSVLTTKRKENKGYWEWTDSNEPFTFFPPSHNFDYRFPLSIETGIALSFDKIKKQQD